MSDASETAITELIDAIPTLAEGADLQDHVARSLKMDLAADIHPYGVLGVRYGLGGTAGLLRYLDEHPKFAAEVKRFRALNDAAENVNERIQLKAAHGLEDALIQTTLGMTDPNLPVAQRIDYVKIHERLSGIGAAAAAKGGIGGARFTVNIMFPNGRVDTLSTTVVDAIQAPPPDEPDL